MESIKKNPHQANPRNLALQVLSQVIADGAYANLALGANLQKVDISAADRALTTKLVYGVLREQGLLDYILEQFLRTPLDKLPLKILLCLRLGLYQFWCMDKIPAAAAINESVKLAKKYGHKGTAGLVNGVLRNIERSRDSIKLPTREDDPVLYLSVCYSHPRWLVEMWLRDFGFEVTEAICRHDNQSVGFSLRVNSLKTDREDILARLRSSGMQAQPGEFAPEAILITDNARIEVKELINAGLVYPQHQSSMLVAHALAPRPGSRVIDLCAAPGGKTTHIAQLMQNQGEIRAFDLHPHKVKLIEDNCQRLGIDIVRAAAGDSRRPPAELQNWADYVLADVPCSGLGVLCSRPDARWHKKPAEIEALAEVAAEILDAAAGLVKVGGVLLFSTCTLTRRENEDNAEAFLQRHPEFEPEAIFAPEPLLYENKAFWRIMPNLHHMDGFFLARFRRKN